MADDRADSDQTSLSVGWREWVGLPDLGIPRIKAKIDTGARTSALHAFRVERFRRDGTDFARLHLHPRQNRDAPVVISEAPVIDERVVTDSGGHRERRIVIESRLQLGDRLWTIELTVTDRDTMRFRLLIGRTAMVTAGLNVIPGASYLLTKPGSTSRS